MTTGHLIAAVGFPAAIVLIGILARLDDRPDRVPRRRRRK